MILHDLKRYKHNSTFRARPFVEKLVVTTKFALFYSNLKIIFIYTFLPRLFPKIFGINWAARHLGLVFILINIDFSDATTCVSQVKRLRNNNK